MKGLLAFALFAQAMPGYAQALIDGARDGKSAVTHLAENPTIAGLSNSDINAVIIAGEWIDANFLRSNDNGHQTIHLNRMG